MYTRWTRSGPSESALAQASRTRSDLSFLSSGINAGTHIEMFLRQKERSTPTGITVSNGPPLDREALIAKAFMTAFAEP